MFCMNCGSSIKEEGNFCQVCGTKIIRYENEFTGYDEGKTSFRERTAACDKRTAVCDKKAAACDKKSAARDKKAAAYNRVTSSYNEETSYDDEISCYEAAPAGSTLKTRIGLILGAAATAAWIFVYMLIAQNADPEEFMAVPIVSTCLSLAAYIFAGGALFAVKWSFLLPYTLMKVCPSFWYFGSVEFVLIGLTLKFIKWVVILCIGWVIAAFFIVCPWIAGLKHMHDVKIQAAFA